MMMAEREKGKDVVVKGKGCSGNKESGKRLRTLRAKLLLRHQLSGCHLFSHKVSATRSNQIGH